MITRTVKWAVTTVAATTMLAAGAPALAETVTYSAELNAASEVPPNDSAGTGTLEATYDTESRLLSWTIEYSGLTGEATAAHFHGPAAPDANAPPVVPVEDLESPIEGEATLTEDLSNHLEAGMLYFNLHTAQYPEGEIRGQVVKE